ncbi:uncharacterized protein SOCEGT47_015530 [Sorangium cellulosum]|uniref:Uncharacterized protein n=1 Tax=Sorangium cellulosum TaxID=56 RepID=A0A4P2PW59_SORCE|nr:uncharacterized protein SOCEGT47_015530 [Sorangium cellulosum]
MVRRDRVGPHDEGLLDRAPRELEQVAQEAAGRIDEPLSYLWADGALVGSLREDAKEEFAPFQALGDVEGRNDVDLVEHVDDRAVGSVEQAHRAHDGDADSGLLQRADVVDDRLPKRLRVVEAIEGIEQDGDVTNAVRKSSFQRLQRLDLLFAVERKRRERRCDDPRTPAPSPRLFVGLWVVVVLVLAGIVGDELAIAVGPASKALARGLHVIVAMLSNELRQLQSRQDDQDAGEILIEIVLKAHVDVDGACVSRRAESLGSQVQLGRLSGASGSGDQVARQWRELQPRRELFAHRSAGRRGVAVFPEHGRRPRVGVETLEVRPEAFEARVHARSLAHSRVVCGQARSRPLAPRPDERIDEGDVMVCLGGQQAQVKGGLFRPRVPFLAPARGRRAAPPRRYGRGCGIDRHDQPDGHLPSARWGWKGTDRHDQPDGRARSARPERLAGPVLAEGVAVLPGRVQELVEARRRQGAARPLGQDGGAL